MRTVDPIARPALVFELRSERNICAMSCPVFDDAADPPSLLGAVTHGQGNEVWPCRKNRPLSPILQLNLANVPFLPKGLEQVEFLTLFLDSSVGKEEVDPSEAWEFRTYSSLSHLEKWKNPEALNGPGTVKFLDLPRLVEDFPSTHEAGSIVDETLPNHQGSHPGVKLGGWSLAESLALIPVPEPGSQLVLQLDGLESMESHGGFSDSLYLYRMETSKSRAAWSLHKRQQNGGKSNP